MLGGGTLSLATPWFPVSGNNGCLVEDGSPMMPGDWNVEGSRDMSVQDGGMASGSLSRAAL